MNPHDLTPIQIHWLIYTFSFLGGACLMNKQWFLGAVFLACALSWVKVI